MHIHKWTKWETTHVEEYSRKTDTWHDLLVQERTCKKCNKLQMEKI